MNREEEMEREKNVGKKQLRIRTIKRLRGEEGGEREAEKHKADLSTALCFVMCEIVHRLSSKLWKLIENIYISMTGGRGSASFL